MFSKSAAKTRLSGQLTQLSSLQQCFFHIDVTFEMRTVLSVIRLFNDTILNVGHHFILNRKGGEESKIAERESL
jgi:hypothetical protein